MKRTVWGFLAAGLLVGLLLTSVEAPRLREDAHASAGRSLSDGTPAAIHKIRHVVIIMQENRSFDSYFGTYPGADGIPGLAGNPGRLPCIPDPLRHRCVHPYHDPSAHNAGGPHARIDAIKDIAGGAMNGFVTRARVGRTRACTASVDSPACSLSSSTP